MFLLTSDVNCVLQKLFGLGDLAVFGDPREDPYLNENLEDEDEQEDIEDFRIR